MTATDLADYLVRAGLPFRDAHHIVAAIVGAARDRNYQSLADFSLTDLQSFSDVITQDVQAILTVEGSVASRAGIGGTSPERVKKAIQEITNLLS